MMGKDTVKQNQLLYINLDDFIPKNHLLRAINNKVDFSFIYDKVSHLYSKAGRRSLDPVMLIKMLLLGYLYGIPSERKLEEEVKLNLAYRWFLGLDLGNSVPDHTTFSQNRRRRFKNSGVFQEIFDHIVSICVEEGLVTGEVIVTDSTHIKANASSSKVEKIIVEKTPSDYVSELEKEAQRLEAELQDKRDAQGKKKCGKKPRPREGVSLKEEVRSTTDPDAALMKRPGKPGGFHYLGHTSIDTKHGIVTDIYVTAGNVNDSHPYVERLQVQETKYGIKIKKAGADKGYDYASVHRGLENMNITSYITPYDRATCYESIGVKHFVYNSNEDVYICPEGKTLKFTNIHRGKNNIYSKVYLAKTKDCKNCTKRTICYKGSSQHRSLERPLFQETIDGNKARANTLEYREVQRLRRIWCEGTFGTLKQQHNLKGTYKRGIENVQEQCLLSALAINLKRMIKVIA